MMNNQQLALIPNELDNPPPVWTKTAIENMLNELTETRRQRNELAEQLKELNLHTDPQTMIEELQWELTSQRAAWLEIVADKDAEINRLTNAALDAACGETMKTDEASDWFALATDQRERLIRLHSENAELRSQYNKMQWELNRQIAELSAQLEGAMFPKI